MKKILVVVVLCFAVLLLVGCGKKGLTGSWKSESGNYTYTFKEDGTGTYDVSGTKMEFTYTTEGSKLSITYKGTTAPFETTFEINGNKLNVKDSFGNDTIYVRK